MIKFKKMLILKIIQRIIFTAISFLIITVHVSVAGETLILSGHPDYPPFEWEQNDEIIGACADLIKLIFKDSGINVDSRYVGNWKRVQENAKYGDIDMIAGLYINEERKLYMDFTSFPYTEDLQVIWVYKGKKFPFKTWDDLIGKVGTAPLGESFGEKFDQFIKEKLDIERVPELIHNFRKLKAGRVNYFPYGLYSAEIKAVKEGYRDDIEYLATPLIINKVYAAFSKKSKFKKYMPKLEQGLKKYIADGTVEKLIQKNLKLYVETK